MYQIQYRLFGGTWIVAEEFQLNADAQDRLLILQEEMPERVWRVSRFCPTAEIPYPEFNPKFPNA